MKTLLKSYSKKLKEFGIKYSAPVFISLFIVLSFIGANYILAANNIVVATTNLIDDKYPGWESVEFIQSFYASGTSTTDTHFVGVWYPASNPSDTHTVTGIGTRPAGQPGIMQVNTPITLNIPYNSVGMVPGTIYMYEIQDTSGVSYLSGNFTSFGTPPPSGSINGLTVNSALSQNGLTVTFTVTGTPANGQDVIFIFSYSALSNLNYMGGSNPNIGVRAAGIPASVAQTMTFTLPTNGGGGTILDNTGAVVLPSDIQYELSDLHSNQYAFGYFSGGQGGAVAGGQGGAVAGGAVAGGAGNAVAGNAVAGGNGTTTTQTLVGGIVPCDGVVTKCTFEKIKDLVNRVILYIIYLTIPIGAIMFAYAGFLLLTKGSSEEARTKAKGIFINVVIGVVVILAAFLIIKTILDALGVTGGWRIFT